jgi:hypothetical protein
MKWTVAALTVLLVHTAAAQAQQSSYPPGYGPPPGYVPSPYGAPPPPPPPPRYYYYSPPPPPPPPPRNVLYRPFTIGGGIGFGGLRLHDHATGMTTSEGGMAYTAHLGFGLAPRLILMWDVEGSVVNRGASFFSQTAHLAALQLFLGDRLFIKGGFGVAQVNQDDISYSAWGGAGMIGIGYELIQSWHWSFDIEATATGARYRNQAADETWTNWSLVNFALNFF